jgi:hypothetical protein
MSDDLLDDPRAFQVLELAEKETSLADVGPDLLLWVELLWARQYVGKHSVVVVGTRPPVYATSLFLQPGGYGELCRLRLIAKRAAGAPPPPSPPAGPQPATPTRDATPAAVTAAATGGADTQPAADTEVLDLDQIAALMHLKRRSLEPYKRRKDDPLPTPDCPRLKRGSRDRWRWSTIHPWLKRNSSVPIPDKFPDIYRRR